MAGEKITYSIFLEDAVTDKLKKAAAAAKELNKELSTSDKEAKGLGKALTQSETAAQGLGKAIGEAAVAGKGLADTATHAKGLGGAAERADTIAKGLTSTIENVKKIGGPAFDFVKSGIDQFNKLKEAGAKAETGLKTTAATAASTTGNLDTYEKHVDSLKVSVGKLAEESQNRLAPAMTAGIDLLQKGVNWIGKNTDLVDAANVAYHIYSEGTKIAEVAVAGYQIATGLATTFEAARAEGLGILEAAQWALNVAMDANPVGLLVIGLAALGGLLYYLWKKTHSLSLILGILFGPVGAAVGYAIQHFDKLKAYLTGFWTMIKDLGNNIGKLFTGVWDIVTHPLHPGKGIDEIKSVVSGAYNAAKDAKNESLAESKAESEKKAQSAAEATTQPDGKTDAPVTTATTTSGTTTTTENCDTRDKKTTGLQNTTPPATTGSAPPQGNKDTSPKSASGGKGATINIHIDKLIEKFEIHCNQMSESYGKIEEHVTNVLLNATNNASINANI